MIPRSLYYKVGHVNHVHRYTVEEATICALDHEHYGPWALELAEWCEPDLARN